MLALTITITIGSGTGFNGSQLPYTGGPLVTFSNGSQVDFSDSSPVSFSGDNNPYPPGYLAMKQSDGSTMRSYTTPLFYLAS